MKLFELLRSDNLDIKKDTPYELWATQKVGDKQVDIEIEQEHDGAPWTVAFLVDGTVRKSEKSSEGTRWLHGDEFKIMAAVFTAIEYFIKRRDPEVVEFSARKGENRENLYARMAARFKQYKVTQSIHPDSDWIDFKLTRKYD